MTGTVPFDDPEWETFCAICDKMSLANILAGYEAAYKRYLSK